MSTEILSVFLKRSIRRGLNTFWLLLFYTSLLHAGKLEIYDGFESGSVGSHWTTKRMVPDSLKFQDKVIKEGKLAIQITIQPKDRFEAGDGTSNDSERDEISEANGVLSELNHEYVHEFSLFIPKDFPIVPTRLVLAQWKEQCLVERCQPDNPILALRYVGGEFYITRQNSSDKRVLFKTKEEVRGRWLNLKFQIRFSRSNDGLIKAWLDGKNVVDFKGATTYPAAGGYGANDKFYFKMGLYRDIMVEPMTVYFDEYRKSEL